MQFSSRPSGFSCPNASKIKSYCDASDPYCCNGSNAATHQGYGAEYGNQAFAFVQSKLSASGSGGSGGGTPTNPPGTTPTPPSSGKVSISSLSVPGVSLSDLADVDRSARPFTHSAVVQAGLAQHAALRGHVRLRVNTIRSACELRLDDMVRGGFG